MAENAPAGLVALNLSVQSAIAGLDSDVIASDAVVITVLASWGGAMPIEVVVEDSSLSIETSGSQTTVVRLSRLSSSTDVGRSHRRPSDIALT